MGQYHNAVIAQLASIHNGLRTNSSELTLSDVLETKKKLESIILELQRIHNSKLAVNRLVPCVLYNIFAFAAYDPSSIPGPEVTVLRISHVCRRWRDFALEWPVLWAFVDPDRSPSIIELFLNRSGNTALTMSCNMPVPSSTSGAPRSSNTPTSFKYLKSCNKSIIPRLCSLTLRFHSSQSNLIRDVLNASGTPLLQVLPLRYLDIGFDRYRNSPLPSLKDFFQINVCSIRGLSLSDINWPWFEHPHPNLTYIKLHSTELPSLFTFLTFLSSCPLLKELLINDPKFEEQLDVPTYPTSAPDDRLLHLPNLERVILESWSCDYIQEISGHVGPSTRLSQFQLICKSRIFSSCNVFDSVRSEILSHFSSHSYLSINWRDGDYFNIMSAPKRELSFGFPTDSSLRISGHMSTKNLPVEEFPIFRLISEVPRIVHLTLIGHAWKILTSPKFYYWFPCLQVLKIEWTSFDKGETFNTPRSGPKLETLILGQHVTLPMEILLGIIPWIRAKFLKLDGELLHKHRRYPEFGKFIAILREIDVKTNVIDWKGEEQCIDLYSELLENPYPAQPLD